MKSLISARAAAVILISLNMLVILFHLLVISGIIPYAIAWGGRLENREQMIVFEIISILVNIFIMVVIAIRQGYIWKSFSPKVANVLVWGLILLFVVNTIGNLLAKNIYEKAIATPLTLAFVLLLYRLSIEKMPPSKAAP